MKKNFFLGLTMLFALSGGSALAADYGLASNPQDGTILHCFDWTLNQIKAELPNIAAAGFTSVQTSPLQGNAGSGAEWYYAYQPYDLCIASSGMGTKSDLQALCAEADKYGIKVIVDVVANHLNGSMDYVASKWKDDQYWHDYSGGIDYNNRWQITHGQIGMRDLNSEHSTVYNAAKAYVQELKDCGVDGIRWDAAKHIGLPSEDCQFWAAVTSISGMWHYGEILEGPTDNGSTDGLMVEYTNYMSVTDNAYCRGMRDNINNGNVNAGYGNWNNRGVADSKIVYWAESHDEYSNNGEYGTNSAYVSVDKINRTYAMIASRNGASALYFSRPYATDKNSIKVGVKGQEQFKNKEVAAVNKFHNAMIGKADYYVAGSNAMAVCRKGGGAVIVMPNGSGNVSITNGGGYVPAGTYTDLVSGNSFTVTSSTISGTVGSTGIAVIYDSDSAGTGGDDSGSTGGSTSGTVTITGDYNIAYSGSHTHVHYWGGTASTWPGVAMTTATGSDGNTYKVAKIDAASTGIVFNTSGNTQTGDLTYTGSYIMNDNGATSTAVIFSNGGSSDSGSTGGGSSSTTGEYYVYLKNSSNWSTPTVWAWDSSNGDANCNSNGTWPGDAMTYQSGDLWKWTAPSGKVPTMIIFSNSGNSQTEDLTFVNGATYNCSGTIVSTDDNTGGDNTGGSTSSDPVLNSGEYAAFFENTVGWSTVYAWVWDDSSNYTGGTWPGQTCTNVGNNVWKWTASQTIPSGAKIIFSNGSGGTVGSTQTDDLDWVNGGYYTISGYVKTITPSSGDNTGGDDSGDDDGDDDDSGSTGGGNSDYVPSGASLSTNYYKTNPNGKSGTNKTINVTGHPASSALSNWTDAELIAQGVARDVAQAMKGNHERPIVDSYALYAAYDNDNLYLGVQFVYTVWDAYGDGKQPGESKPYNMDGRIMIAFDLDPDKSFDGYINGTKAIWNDEGAPGAKFNNGVDAVWIGSTKPGVGTPGFFIPTADGHASYDAAYCKTSTVSYGYADGLLPSISNIYGQESFNFNASVLETNDGFVDLSGEIDASAHTFYEFKIPLSLLGITKSYITSTGIGVQYLDIYGSSPVGGTPYDPSFFDNVTNDYSMDPSSSQEKEDEDVITYALARVGKLDTSNIQDVAVSDNSLNVYTNNGVLYIVADEDTVVTIVSADGRMTQREVVAGKNVIDDLNRGFYIVNNTKVVL